MIRSKVPPIFYKFADDVIDATPDYNSSNEEMVEWGLSKFYGDTGRSELKQLAACLEQMLGGQFTDAELNQFYSASNANIKYSDPKLLRELLEEALVIIDRKLAQT